MFRSDGEDVPGSAQACAVQDRASQSHEMQDKKETDGRGERIRTSDSCVPNAVLYQAELRPDRIDDSAKKT